VGRSEKYCMGLKVSYVGGLQSAVGSQLLWKVEMVVWLVIKSANLDGV